MFYKNFAYLYKMKNKSKYIGQCDKIRQTLEGENFWQTLMNNRKEIKYEEFISIIDLTQFENALCEDDETIETYINEAKRFDADLMFFVSIIEGKKYAFMQHAGFEFIFELNY